MVTRNPHSRQFLSAGDPWEQTRQPMGYTPPADLTNPGIGPNSQNTNPFIDYAWGGVGTNPFGAQIDQSSEQELAAKWDQSPQTAMINAINRAGGTGNQFGRYYQQMQQLAPGMHALYQYLSGGQTAGAVDWITAWLGHNMTPGATSNNSVAFTPDEARQIMASMMDNTNAWWDEFIQNNSELDIAKYMTDVFSALAYGNYGRDTVDLVTRAMDRAATDFFNSSEGAYQNFVDYVKQKNLFGRILG